MATTKTLKKGRGRPAGAQQSATIVNRAGPPNDQQLRLWCMERLINKLGEGNVDVDTLINRSDKLVAYLKTGINPPDEDEAVDRGRIGSAI